MSLSNDNSSGANVPIIVNEHEQMHNTHSNQDNFANCNSKSPPMADNKLNSFTNPDDFGWCELRCKFEKFRIPYFTRVVTGSSSPERYISVRMLEQKLLSKYINQLPFEVYSCCFINSGSDFLTAPESELLNEINSKQANFHFGKEKFSTKDLVIKLDDVKELHHFLSVCHKKLVLKKIKETDRCGFFRINKDSIVAYTKTSNGSKLIPMFYFEKNEETHMLKSEIIDGWDLVYLKFLFKVQGIKQSLFVHDTCRVITVEEVKQHFPEGTVFELYWPEEIHGLQYSATGPASLTSSMALASSSLTASVMAETPPTPFASTDKPYCLEVDKSTGVLTLFENKNFPKPTDNTMKSKGCMPELDTMKMVAMPENEAMPMPELKMVPLPKQASTSMTLIHVEESADDVTSKKTKASDFPIVKKRVSPRSRRNIAATSLPKTKPRKVKAGGKNQKTKTHMKKNNISAPKKKTKSAQRKTQTYKKIPNKQKSNLSNPKKKTNGKTIKT